MTVHQKYLQTVLFSTQSALVASSFTIIGVWSLCSYFGSSVHQKLLLFYGWSSEHQPWQIFHLRLQYGLIQQYVAWIVCLLPDALSLLYKPSPSRRTAVVANMLAFPDMPIRCEAYINGLHSVVINILHSSKYDRKGNTPKHRNILAVSYEDVFLACRILTPLADGFCCTFAYVLQ